MPVLDLSAHIRDTTVTF